MSALSLSNWSGANELTGGYDISSFLAPSFEISLLLSLHLLVDNGALGGPHRRLVFDAQEVEAGVASLRICVRLLTPQSVTGKVRPRHNF